MKLIEVIANTGSQATISIIAEKYKARDFRLGQKGEDGRQPIRMLVTDEFVQPTLDALQNILGAQSTARIIVFPVDATLPRAKTEQEKEQDVASSTREAMYASVEKNTRLDSNFIFLVILSTVVAAIGLVKNNVAVVIGAMVIAPLLGPNLAFGLGTALGDIHLMQKSLKSLLSGIIIAIVLSYLIGLLWPFGLTSPELLARTEVGMDSLALALASGAAAALSLTTGLPSVLVGVMVAVALLPPAAAVGLTLGHSRPDLAMDACLLLAANIVCVNLAAKLVFLVKGIQPRTWAEKAKAKRAMSIYIGVWIVTLVLVTMAIVARSQLSN
ncbi:MAG: TIGR00341 family protein [Candidatus Thiodiazotropha sp. (ex Lucinoma borealis)]|nr:TIGR00341 family protein [Candidatus Thiodiazotropha sp. (ex Lucinoma borealis)]MCU7856573.1 TIGR00341 family protein [Candidatus Thiodiazotropha sp. (ex Lucinoma borealis)]MCU7869978.1 TIGR00341 family protein [Candidatus Thiodiazotropha sp. (ex Lucinoma borealis)]